MTGWSGEDGYVTVAVVGVTALMAALVAGLLAMSRPTAVLTRLDVEQLRDETLVEAGLNAAAFLLFFAGEPAAAVDGQRLAVGGTAVRLAVSPESGRIDLNTSSPDLLRRLFASAKGTSMSPDAFAARVEDWRDADDDRSFEGAEAFDYAAAAPGSVRPANAPFRSVGELRFLLGLAPGDRAAIEPFLTTFNRDGRVDPKAAVGLVRTVIAGGGLAVEAKDAAAPSAEHANAAEGEAAASKDAPAAFRVRVLARAAAGASVRGAEAIIAPPVGDGAAYSVLEWRDLPRAAFADALEANVP